LSYPDSETVLGGFILVARPGSLKASAGNVLWFQTGPYGWYGALWIHPKFPTVSKRREFRQRLLTED
jgi:hypothetical protein